MSKLAASFALLLAACTSSTSGSSDPSTVIDELGNEGPLIESAHFTTTTGIAQNPAPNVDVTVTGNAARAIYGATITLPAGPTGVISCPIDWGVTYTLHFTTSNQTAVEATLDPNGCGFVNIQVDDGSVVLWTATASMYWSNLAYDLGIAEATIFPYSPAGHDTPR